MNFQSLMNQLYLEIVRERKDLIVDQGFSEELVLMLVKKAYEAGSRKDVHGNNRHPANILYHIDDILDGKYGV